MLEELDKLIVFIDKEFNKIDSMWKQNSSYIPINQKNKLVKDIDKDDRILKAIIDYRLFINTKHLSIKMAFDKLNLKNEVNSRVKALNSIEFKINNYLSEKHNYGKNPINKCFNDLYGIRIIFQNDITYNEINSFVQKQYRNKLKCINSNKGEYVATHIYF